MYSGGPQVSTGWGVIGCGGIANRTIPDGILAAGNANLVGVTDLVAERAQAAAGKFETTAYGSSEELIADPAVDAVYMATPPSAHVSPALAAAAAGKHVLVEKPMAVNVQECEELVKACRDNGVILGHATMMRFNAVHQRMREMIQDGAVGRPLAVHARYNVWWQPDLPMASDDDAEVWRETDNRQMKWRQQKRIGGGGPMMDDGVHAIDTMVFLLGHVAEVSSFCDTLTRDRDIEDTASVLLKFENRAQGVLECFASVPNFQGRRLLQVMGSDGVLFAKETLGPPSYDKDQLFYFKPEENYSVEVEPREIVCEPVEMYEKMFSLFSEAVEGGDPYPIPGDEGLHIQRILDAVYRSSEERRYVTIG